MNKIMEINTEQQILNKIRLEASASLGLYTKLMFKAQTKKDFIVNSHHLLLFDVLQRVVDGELTKVIINMPPRYGKTEVVVKSFISWCYGLNPSCKFLHLSYSDTLVNDNSETIRNTIADPLYQTLFPNTKLAKVKGAKARWKTAQGGEFYAVSTQGQVTGFGAGKILEKNPSKEKVISELPTHLTDMDDITDELLGKIKVTNTFEGALVIDDPIKPEDAQSDVLRERVNMRFETTVRNRTNSRMTPIIVIMQRTHEHDLSGHLMSLDNEGWYVLSIPAIVEEDGESKALWNHKHTIEELRALREIDSFIFDTQYMQNPTPREGLMYSQGFGTYHEEELRFKGYSISGKSVTKYQVINYTDTADTGADYLCSISALETEDHLYVVGILYTKKPMEVTEPALAEMLTLTKTDVSYIESNNGGRGFARSVEGFLRKLFKNNFTAIRTFTQTKNKYVRIFNNSADVQRVVKFPVGWEKRWPLFHSHITAFRKESRTRNQADDAADCLTGLVERFGAATKIRKPRLKS